MNSMVINSSFNWSPFSTFEKGQTFITSFAVPDQWMKVSDSEAIKLAGGEVSKFEANTECLRTLHRY